MPGGFLRASRKGRRTPPAHLPIPRSSPDRRLADVEGWSPYYYGREDTRLECFDDGNDGEKVLPLFRRRPARRDGANQRASSEKYRPKYRPTNRPELSEGVTSRQTKDAATN